MDDEKVFVISSGAFGQHLVPEIHDIPHLDTIYIFCGNKARHEQWVKQWSKIRGVFTSIKPICELLKKVARDCEHDAIPMSFVPKRMTIAAAEGGGLGQQTFGRLEPSYLYSVLFKEIILEINEDADKPIKDLVVYGHQQKMSESELKDFQLKYNQKPPVWWYTYEIFLC
ncbi:unnamed protein product, partial [Rotaria sp. Silwood1]